MNTSIEQKIIIGDDSPEEVCEKIIVSVQGETHTIPYNNESNILKCLIENGLDVPYACLSGSCMACMAKVVSGRVYQEDLCSLMDENIRDHEALMCQSVPMSKTVNISYEDV